MEEASSTTSGSPILSPDRDDARTPTAANLSGYTRVIEQSPFGPYEEEDHLKSPGIRQAPSSDISPKGLGIGSLALHEDQSEILPLKFTGETATGSEAFSSGSLSIDHWATSTTRYVKIMNMNPRFNTTDLFKYLIVSLSQHPYLHTANSWFQEIGEIEDFNTSRLLSEGICVVSYFDLRDAIAAYLKCATDHAMWILQFCSHGYFDSVSRF